MIRTRLFKPLLALTCLISFSSAQRALAADWGYEDVGDMQQEQRPQNRRGNIQLTPVKRTIEDLDDALRDAQKKLDKAKREMNQRQEQEPEPQNTESEQSPDPEQNWRDSDATVNSQREAEEFANSPTKLSPQQKIVSEWLSMLGLVVPIAEHGKLPDGPDYSNQLTEEQRKRFTIALNNLLNGKDQAAFRSIDRYWPALARLMEDPDHRGNYRLLFRALLTMRGDSSDIGEDERAMLHEALGPKRIAEFGPPPLTEDAIDAYADMACFLYERSHKGKTVDADDNRELYALIVRDKFKNAPTNKDKEAMNAFPLGWAKFRILYTDANESEKVLLAERIASEQGTKGLKIRNAMLEEVLQSPVWLRFLMVSKPVPASMAATPKALSPRTTGSGTPQRSSTAKPAYKPRNW